MMMMDQGEEGVGERPTTLVHHLTKRPTNVGLLAIICFLFSGFAASEIVAALVANSLSLLGDAASMVVDAVTYGLNMFAEKKKGGGISHRTRMKLEFYIPLFSVLALLGTSIYVLIEAIDTIRAPPKEATTHDGIMLVFSVANLLLDFVSLFCFARLNRLFGFETMDGHQLVGDDEEEDEQLFDEEIAQAYEYRHELPDSAEGGIRTHDHSNTNMCSAYTHVIADTLRSIAVLIAAAISLSSEHVDADLADAYAAIVVSVVIFFSIMPLFSGLKQKYLFLYTR